MKERILSPTLPLNSSKPFHISGPRVLRKNEDNATYLPSDSSSHLGLRGIQMTWAFCKLQSSLHLLYYHIHYHCLTYLSKAMLLFRRGLVDQTYLRVPKESLPTALHPETAPLVHWRAWATAAPPHPCSAGPCSSPVDLSAWRHLPTVVGPHQQRAEVPPPRPAEALAPLPATQRTHGTPRGRKVS